jgi:hypothetical protein
MNSRTRPAGRIPGTAGRQVRFECNRRRRRSDIPHLIVYSVQKAKRGNLFPYRTVDRLTEDPHVCEVRL